MISGLFQKISTFFSPPPPPPPRPPPPPPPPNLNVRESSRMTQYIDYKVNDCIINYIQVDNTRLFYKAFDKEETVQTLQEQFIKIHQKELVLQNQNVKISPNMPLHQILNSTQSRKAFQEIINKIEHKQQISINKDPQQKKVLLDRIIKKCNDFHSYESTIYMKNGPRKPIELGFKIAKDTTFNSIIKQMNKVPQIVGQDIEFEAENGQKYDLQLYCKPFQELNIRQSIFMANYSFKNSLIRGNSLISVNNYEGKLIPVHLLATQQKPQIISFNCKFKKTDLNKLSNFKQVQVIQYYRLTLSMKIYQQSQKQSPQIVFESTGSLRIFVLTQEFDQIWLPVETLQMHHQVGGIDPYSNTFVIYKIKNIEKINLQKPELFYGIQVLPAHQYIANSIIVHNSDSFTIKAYHINQGEKTIEQVRFYRHQRIDKYFQGKICEVGGFQLKNEQTFGDYQLDQFQIMYVYDRIEERNKKREVTFSEWKKESIEKCQQDDQKNQEYNKMIEEEYFGIYQQRIIASKEIKQIESQNKTKIVNILVGLRMYFERLNYFMNKNPQYSKFQKKAISQYEHLKKNKQFRQVLKKKQNKDMNIEQMLGAYLYTTDEVYGEVNKYLRQNYVKDDVTQDAKYLPLVGWVSKSTKCAKTFSGTVYRGVKDINLEKALGLDKRKQLANESEGINNKYEDKFIIFTSFTSTSTAKSAASNFLGSKTSSFLTIIVNKGHFLGPLSHYPSEEQVLIQPFTYFVINSYNLEGQLQTAELQQIPMPQTNSEKIIFWVDDLPDNNNEIIKKEFEPKGIQVVQVKSTRIMKIILQNFFWIFKMLGKKVVIISDMVRKENGVQNYYAGVDLFMHIYNEYGLSNKAIISCGDRIKALANIQQRGVIDGNWFVTDDEDQLIKQVIKQFSKM